MNNIPFLTLGKPNPAIPFTEGPCAVHGRYTPDGRIAFEGQCVYPWEFMATGTGVSGLTIAGGPCISTRRLTFPCGLAQEDSPFQGDRRCISIHPSMQGLGTGVIPVLEMLLQDYPDLLIVLPCWDPKVAVRFMLMSPYAGKVTVDYDPKRGATVHAERPIQIKCGDGILICEKETIP